MKMSPCRSFASTIVSIVCDKPECEDVPLWLAPVVDPLTGVDTDVSASIRCFCECTLFNDELPFVDDVLKLLLLIVPILFTFDIQLALPKETAFSSDSASRGVE